jgi:hypothetical protein
MGHMLKTGHAPYPLYRHSIQLSIAQISKAREQRIPPRDRRRPCPFWPSSAQRLQRQSEQASGQPSFSFCAFAHFIVTVYRIKWCYYQCSELEDSYAHDGNAG